MMSRVYDAVRVPLGLRLGCEVLMLGAKPTTEGIFEKRGMGRADDRQLSQSCWEGRHSDVLEFDVKGRHNHLNTITDQRHQQPL